MIRPVPALLLAAGRGTRLTPHTGGAPKPLVQLAGKSLLAWNLDWLAGARVVDVWINVHHRPEAIRSAVGDGRGYGLSVRYSEEETLLGTAGAWKRLECEWTGTSLVVYGDNFMRFDLARMAESHRTSGALATIAVFDPALHAHTGTGGGQVTVDEAGRVVSFEERRDPGGRSVAQPAAEANTRTSTRTPTPDRGTLINAGVYLLEPAVAEWIPAGQPADFALDVFPRLVTTGGVRAHVLEPGGFCLGLDTPERLRLAERLVAAGAVRA